MRLDNRLALPQFANQSKSQTGFVRRMGYNYSRFRFFIHTANYKMFVAVVLLHDNIACYLAACNRCARVAVASHSEQGWMADSDGELGGRF